VTAVPSDATPGHLDNPGDESGRHHRIDGIASGSEDGLAGGCAFGLTDDETDGARRGSQSGGGTEKVATSEEHGRRLERS
jgi:hypothetical protein